MTKYKKNPSSTFNNKDMRDLINTFEYEINTSFFSLVLSFCQYHCSKCTYCKSNILLLIGNENLLCDKLTVTGDDWADVTGTYIISNEKASKAPDKPVYKLEGQDRFIYYTLRGGAGWCIGGKEYLSGETEGLCYYYSKNFIPFLSKCAYMIDDILILLFSKVVLTLLNHGW